jgi:hypothetical protein
MLAGKKLSGSTQPGLDFVGYEKNIMLVANLPYLL